MRFVDRGQKVPTALMGDTFVRLREGLLEHFRLETTHRNQTRRMQLSSEKRAINGQQNRKAIEDHFHRLCAYCEGVWDAGPVHQHRPPADAAPVDDTVTSHLYYAWLAIAWQNLYPICMACDAAQASQRREYFPVDGPRLPLPRADQIEQYIRQGDGRWPEVDKQLNSERAWLLDPCQEKNLNQHFGGDRSGRLLPLSARAAFTIDRFSLNRPVLITNRQIALTELIGSVTKFVKDHVFSGGSGVEAQYDWHLCQQFVDAIRSPVGKMDRFGLHCGYQGLFFDDWLKRSSRALRSALKIPGERVSRAAMLQELCNHPSGSTYLNWALSQVARDRPAIGSQSDIGLPPGWTEEQTRQNGGKQNISANWSGGSDLKFSGIKSFSISKFKCLDRLDIRFPQFDEEESGQLRFKEPALLIIGQNAAGKSAVLEAITLMMLTPNRRKTLNLDGNDLILDPHLLGQLGVPQLDEQRVKQASLTVTYKVGQPEEYRISAGENTVRRSDKGEQEQESSHAPEFLFCYGAFRQFCKEQELSDESHYRSLFDSTYLLPHPAPWLSGLSEQKFDMIGRVLRDILGPHLGFRKLGRNEREVSIYTVPAMNTQGESGPTEADICTPLDRVSSGFRAVLAMAFDIMRGISVARGISQESFENARGVVLVDEIEAHLHPQWKYTIIDGLRRAFPNMTFIFTSHDALCLRSMLQQETIVLRQYIPHQQNEGQVPLITTEAISDLPNTDDWRIEQLLTDDFFGLPTTEGHARSARWRSLMERLTNGESPAEQADLDEFLDEFSNQIPVGSSKVRRLVNDAIAEYLHQRATRSARDFAQIDQELKSQIKAVLTRKGVQGP